MPTLTCPECKAPMTLRQGPHSMFYGCTRWPDCSGSHGAHADGTPLGVPANRKTKLYRMAAHKAFDPLWKSQAMNRHHAYVWMAQAMGMTPEEAHIGRFTKEQCTTLIRAVHRYKAELEVR